MLKLEYRALINTEHPISGTAVDINDIKTERIQWLEKHCSGKTFSTKHMTLSVYNHTKSKLYYVNKVTGMKCNFKITKKHFTCEFNISHFHWTDSRGS